MLDMRTNVQLSLCEVLKAIILHAVITHSQVHVGMECFFFFWENKFCLFERQGDIGVETGGFPPAGLLCKWL